jgi:hypothetical protein
MKVITVATESGGYFNTLIESSKKYNYQLIILGFGNEWKGFGWRVKLVLNFLKQLPPEEIVMMVDAYDVIFLRDSKDIIDEFKKLNTRFLCGAFRKINGIIGYVQEKEFGKCKNNLLYPYVNICAGTWMGYVEDIINLYSKYEIDNNQDDQILLNIIYDQVNNQKIITADTKFNIFCTLFPNLISGEIRDEDKIIVNNNELICGNTNTKPFAIHGLANTKLNNILYQLEFKNYDNNVSWIYTIKKVFYHLGLLFKMTFLKYFYR